MLEAACKILLIIFYIVLLAVFNAGIKKRWLLVTLIALSSLPLGWLGMFTGMLLLMQGGSAPLENSYLLHTPGFFLAAVGVSALSRWLLELKPLQALAMFAVLLLVQYATLIVGLQLVMAGTPPAGIPLPPGAY